MRPTPLVQPENVLDIASKLGQVTIEKKRGPEEIQDDLTMQYCNLRIHTTLDSFSHTKKTEGPNNGGCCSRQAK